MLTALSEIDLQPVWLSLKLATLTTFFLLALTIPLAWWLSREGSQHFKGVIGALATLPLVLPPSVLGFYLLLMLGPRGPVGQLSEQLGLGSLAFSFEGLLVASVIYSFPFALQPIQNAFQAMGKGPMEAAATLRASPLDRFFTIALPLVRPGIITGAILAFAHTMGEFGVILMIGGNIPGETKVLSVAIYDHVESMEYTQAHILAGGMLVFSFLVLFSLNSFNNLQGRRKA